MLVSLSKKSLKKQRASQNTHIEEEQTTQWPKEKSTKEQKTVNKIHTYKAKARVTRTPLKTGGELRCSGRVGSSCFTSGTLRASIC